MREQFANQPKQPETLENYRATCHKFRMENAQYYTENNFFCGSVQPLEGGIENASEESKKNLEQVEKFYIQEGDNYNLLRLNEKLGNKEEVYKLAEQIWSEEDLLVKANVAREIWQHYRDEKWRNRAGEAFLGLIEKYKSEQNNLLLAVDYDTLFKITGNQQYKEKAIEYHQVFAGEREEKGDSWWRAISLREIAKISRKKEDINMAFEAANFEIERAEKVGDFKNAGLWARDLARLIKTSENKARAEKLFLKQIEIGERESDTRVIAKSYWEMWKATNKGEYKNKALEFYKKLLNEVKDSDNKERIEECYRVMLYLS